MPIIVPIVEGRGENDSVSLLIRRILNERFAIYDIEVARSVNALSKGNLTRSGGIEKFVELALRVRSVAGILVMCDADTECAVALAAGLAERVRSRHAAVPVAMACPTHEYEAWILASWQTISGRTIKGGASVRSDIEPPFDVESLRNPKAWLADAMAPSYKPTIHQASLTQMLDLQLAEASRSFRRLCHAVEQLVAGIRQGTSSVTP
jgi:hypothetical protein